MATEDAQVFTVDGLYEPIFDNRPFNSGYDFGLKGDGVTDNKNALTAAGTAVGDYGIIQLQPGSYYVSGTPTLNNVMLEGSDATFSASVPGVTDLATLDKTNKWSAVKFTTAGTAVAGSANQQGTSLQGVFTATSSQVSYQKNLLYLRGLSYDPSDTVTPITRDVVISSHQGFVANTNATARLWASHSLAQINTGGGDGLVYGHEIEVYNYGTSQATVGTNTSKYGLHVVAGGDAVSTAGIYINRKSTHTGNYWESGIYINDTAVNTSAIMVGAGKFAVSAAGFIGVGVAAPGVQLDMEGTTNCRARFTGSGGASAIYTTYIHKATRAFTTGLDTASQEFRITGAEGLTANVLFRAKTNGDLAFRNSAPIAKPTVTGSRGGNAALASLLTALANQGLITDSTTA
jgi:hypothetical protein